MIAKRAFVPLFLLIAVLCAFGYFNRVFFKANEGFSPQLILPNWPKCPRIETPPFDKPILNQSFTYLSKGNQAFVFLSEDGNWVLKLLRIPRFARLLSLKGKASSLRFFNQTLEGCRLAYIELSDETQVVYSHLHPTHGFTQPIKLVDRLGRIHLLDLNTLLFVVQRRGDPFFSTLGKADIDNVLDLFRKLYAKKIIDHDAILERNYGVYKNKPFIIDTGQLIRDENLPTEEQYLRHLTHGLSAKIQKDFPSLHDYYEKALRRNESLIKNPD